MSVPVSTKNSQPFPLGFNWHTDPRVLNWVALFFIFLEALNLRILRFPEGILTYLLLRFSTLIFLMDTPQDE